MWILPKSTENLMQSVSDVSSTRTKRKGPWWSGDPSVSPRCLAKTRSGAPCRAPAMWSKKAGRYTRCRLHGGASTGPRTPAGLERCRKANWKHGRRSAEWIAERRLDRLETRRLVLESKQLAREVRDLLREEKRRQRAEAANMPLIVAYSPEMAANGVDCGSRPKIAGDPRQVRALS